MPYNPEFIGGMDIRDVKANLVHEVCHVAFEHFPRGDEAKKVYEGKGFDPVSLHDVANVAMDYAVNWILEQNGFSMSKLLKCPSEYRGKAFEEIFHDLVSKAEIMEVEVPAQSLPSEGEGSGCGGMGSGSSSGSGDDDSSGGKGSGSGSEEDEKDEDGDGSGGSSDGEDEGDEEGSGGGSGDDEEDGKEEGSGGKGKKDEGDNSDGGDGDDDEDSSDEEGKGGKGGRVAKGRVKYKLKINDQSLDRHLDEGEGTGDLPTQQREIDWKQVLVEAYTYAKMQGSTPAGIESFIDDMLKPPEFNWRELLYKYITTAIPNGHTWVRRRKTSYPLGVYLPAQEKEGIEVLIILDTSGSVGDDEYIEFLSEIAGISGAFRGTASFRALMCDMEVEPVQLEPETDIEELVEVLRKRRGYGGTSFVPPFEYIEDNDLDPKLIIYFTDAYGDFPDEVRWPTIWVISRSGDPSRVPEGIGEVIKMTGGME